MTSKHGASATALRSLRANPAPAVGRLEPADYHEALTDIMSLHGNMVMDLFPHKGPSLADD